LTPAILVVREQALEGHRVLLGRFFGPAGSSSDDRVECSPWDGE